VHALLLQLNHGSRRNPECLLMETAAKHRDISLSINTLLNNEQAIPHVYFWCKIIMANIGLTYGA
jgi:hypothetical protein